MNPNIRIDSIMTSRLVTLSPDAPMSDVREVFSKNTFHHIPVTDAGEVLMGIISREDFFKIAYVLSIENSLKTQAKAHFQHLQAKDIMTQYPLKVEPSDSIGLAADIFLANKFHALPVVDGERLVGIVTSHDLLAHCFESPIEANWELEEFREE